MDKTHNISLGGFAFIIEENALFSLKKYLDEINLYLQNDTGKQEVINDIEYRMAEIFGEQLKNNRQVINLEDVNHIKKTLGEPSQFVLDGDESETKKLPNLFPLPSKKLYRDSTNKKLGGVAAGIAHYFSIDPTWVRIGLLCLPFLDFLFLGISTISLVLAYIILWIVIPEANTTAEKLEMYGDHVNVDSLRNFDRTATDSKKKLNTEDVIKRLLKLGLKIVIGLISLFLLAVSITLAVSAIALFVGGFTLFSTSFIGFSMSDFLPLVFDHDWEIWLFYPSLFLLISLPIIGLILVFIRIISTRFRIKKEVSYALVTLFFIALIGFSVISISTLRAFQRGASVTESIDIQTSPSEILMVENISPASSDEFEFSFDFSTLEFVPSLDSLARVEITKTAKGKNLALAKKHANFKSSVRTKPNKIQFKDKVSIYDFEKWRLQNEKVTIEIPEGQKIQFRNVSYLTTKHQYTPVENNTTYVFKNNRLYTEKEWQKNGAEFYSDTLQQDVPLEDEMNKNDTYIPNDDVSFDSQWD